MANATDPREMVAQIFARMDGALGAFSQSVGELEAKLARAERRLDSLHDQNQFLLKRTHDLNTTTMVLLQLLTNECKQFTLEDVRETAAKYAAACAIDAGVTRRLARLELAKRKAEAEAEALRAQLKN